MVNTIKFSQFNTGNLNDTTNQQVGFGSGSNYRLPLQNTWTVSTRPSSPFNGLMGFNTDNSTWEYWSQPDLMWLTFQTTNIGETWTEVTALSITTVVNNGYIANRTPTPVQFLLPAAMSIGERVLIAGLGAGKWVLNANAGQTIYFGSQSTSVGGSISADIQYGNIEVKCIADNISWTVWTIFGNPTIL